MKLALRIEVATLRGAREAAPRLARLLKEHGAGATFLFNLGPDRTGRLLGRLPRVPPLRCYGPVALLSGTLLPAPDVGRRAADAMRGVRAEGFEAGILAYDHAAWTRGVARADESWTRAAMERACARYGEIFGAPALTHGAPGWHMNRYAYRYTQRLAFCHGSDCRGPGPFIPVVQGEIAACPQLPTTLPTLDELLAGGLDRAASVRRLAELARLAAAPGPVYSMRAEIEGTVFEPVLRELLAAWRADGHQLVSLHDYAAGLDLARLPRRVIVEQAAPGARGTASAAGKEFLA